MTMLERIGNAIFEEMDIADGLDLTVAHRYALAAVKALRDVEPTEEMMSAMWSLRYANTKESFAACWASILDALLATQPQEQER